MEITFEIDKAKVYEEVAQTTSYTGAKMDDDATAYERILTTDEDQSQLERFWNESCTTFCEVMKRYLVYDNITYNGSQATGHQFKLNLSCSFDSALLPSMRQELFSFFVMNITSKWYGFTNKNEAAGYAESAAGLLESIHRKACYKRKPVRPVYREISGGILRD